jgi:hypothetical protein
LRQLTGLEQDKLGHENEEWLLKRFIAADEFKNALIKKNLLKFVKYGDRS